MSTSLKERYVVDESKVLGQGSYGIVVEAASRQEPSRKFAIKVFRSSPDHVREWEKECAAYRSLGFKEEEGFVQMHECGWEMFSVRMAGFCSSRPLRPFLRLTLVNGKTGERSHSMAARESWKTLLRSFARLSAQLVRVHDSNLVVRDLKPANVMFDHREMKPYIIDLGFAYNVQLASAYRSKGVSHSFKATMPWALPDVAALWTMEQRLIRESEIVAQFLMDDSVELRQANDAWALGMVFLELFLHKAKRPNLAVLLGLEPTKSESSAFDFLYCFFIAMRRLDSVGAEYRQRWNNGFLLQRLPILSEEDSRDEDCRVLLEFLQRLFRYQPKTPSPFVSEIRWFANLARAIPSETPILLTKNLSQTRTIPFSKLRKDSAMNLRCEEEYRPSPGAKDQGLPPAVDSAGESALLSTRADSKLRSPASPKTRRIPHGKTSKDADRFPADAKKIRKGPPRRLGRPTKLK